MYQEGIGGSREQSRIRVVTDEKNTSDVRHMRYPIRQGEKMTFYPVQAACQQDQDVLRLIRTMVVRLGEEHARVLLPCARSSNFIRPDAKAIAIKVVFHILHSAILWWLPPVAV